LYFNSFREGIYDGNVNRDTNVRRIPLHNKAKKEELPVGVALLFNNYFNEVSLN